ncbi:secretin N-terminal domain-containing protein [Blastopirellula marina]|uniref:General secretion pathway protein D (Precursor) n=1 Tax=Blastopirellula marina DSM 3645 TaxID=314230 RepID=A4A016_9BACT|nr:secretin N-terminal domain-containing protein [Blastopirellula marina]EAQ77963.1 general secretion pathway protein D (precursor) [Blastopirellula marina DSM 3645]
MLYCILGQRRSLIIALFFAAWFAGAADPALAQAPATAGAREIRSYSVDPERLQNLLEVFRQLYAEEKGATFTSDAKGGALVVAAPEEVQSQVAAFLKRSGYLREGNTNVAPVRVATPVENARHQQTRSLGNGQVEVEVKLSQADWRQVENRTTQLLGQRPPVALTAEGAIATLTLPTRTDKKIAMQIYRKDNVVLLRGDEEGVKAWSQVVRAIDAPPRSDEFRTDLVSLRNAKREDVAEALAPLTDTENSMAKREIFEALKKVAGKQQLRWSGDMAAMIFQPGEAADGAAADDAQPAADQPAPQMQPAVEDQVTLGPDDDAGLIGPVQIEFLEGLDVIVVRGHRRDVERITRIINDIERLSAETQPVIEVRELLHANSEAVAATILQLYEDLLQTRYGQVSITPLGRPNAILLIGRQQSVDGILDLIEKLDQPVGPERMLRVFQLKYLSSADAQTRVTEFYAEPVNLNPRVRSTADYRSNALIVQASPRDMAEVEYLIRQIDVPAAESTLELKVFELRNSLAEDLATVLQAAISGTPAAGTGGQQQGGAAAAQVRAAMLSFMTLDSREGQLLKSGILTDAQITADTRSNALVVRAPKDSMDLIGALIQRLDSQPSAESQIKVFTIVNGDATQLATMLETLFGLDEGTTQGQQPFAIGAGGDNTLVPIRFSVDSRTNSIIASGPASSLAVVEAILLRLDQDDVQQRQMLVVRLKNSNALLVAESLTELLQTESQLQQIDPTLTSSFQQVAREVIVVPETFSNSLIITATPRYFKQIVKIVEELDARPPMVSIQVLIADVRLGKIEELGFEFGLQDSLLFDRSTVSSGQLDPGYNFNNAALGNSSSAASLATASAVGSQGLSDLGLGRTNPALGYGGFVFSAASESVNVLIRALQQDNRMEVLARPHVMTMDNQPAFIQVGQRVPYITDTQVTNQGTVNSITLENTGVILNVIPRISPDGMVVMYVQAERSEVGNEADGIPISINQNGDVIRAPRINTQTATTTVSARSGQTIVLGGLIQKRTTVVSRRVPLLGDIPVVGSLFRYDSFDGDRSELMIILTPTVVDSDQDVERVREQEMSRMSWCLADVAEIYGAEALYGVDHSIPEGEILEIHPDRDPAAPRQTHEKLPEGIPAPMTQPTGSGVAPPLQQQSFEEPGNVNFNQPQLAPATLQPASFGVAPAAYNSASLPREPRPVRLPAVR